MSKGIVSVFGGSSPQPGSPAYQEAYTLGELLAQAGYTVMTGGYYGTMEAASKGAKAAGGHVIGVTVSLFERSGRLTPNPYNDEVIRYDNLHERLLHLVARCNAAVALRGGIGTLSEVALTWSLLQVGQIGPKPLILLGRQWQDLLTQFFGAGEYVRPDDMKLWTYAQTPQEAVSTLDGWLGQ